MSKVYNILCKHVIYLFIYLLGSLTTTRKLPVFLGSTEKNNNTNTYNNNINSNKIINNNNKRAILRFYSIN